MNKYITADGNICSGDVEHCLKLTVKQFQQETNEYIKRTGTTEGLIYWAYGNYCVDTDYHYVRCLDNGRFTYDSPAFR